MIHPKDFLRGIGLSKSETTLYLNGLEAGESTVSDLVKRTHLGRPTAYHGLDALVSKKLATKNKKGKELYYQMHQPEAIEGYMQAKAGDLLQNVSVLSGLLSFFPTASTGKNLSAMEVSQFTGEKEVKKAIDTALYCKNKRWDIIAPRHTFIAETDAAYIEYFKNTRDAQDISSRSLWEGGNERNLTLRDIVSRKPRYLPKEYEHAFKGMMILFDDKVLLISSYEVAEAIIVKSSEFHQLLTVLFEAMWSQAIKP